MALLLFFYGVAIGSFLNVLVDRLPAGRKILNSRSICDSCNKKLRWYELIPLVSYAIQKGKCRTCHAKIPTRIFIVELCTGLLFSFLYMFVYPSTGFLGFVVTLVVVCSLIVIFFADFEYGIIPDQMLIAITLVALVYHMQTGITSLLQFIVVGGILLGIFLLLFIATKGRGIGFGDVKFAFVIGFLMGYPGGVFAVYFAFLTGAVISLILILVGRKKFRKDTISFGPFLVLGIVTYYIFAGPIQMYLHSFGL